MEIEIQGIKLRLAPRLNSSIEWIGQEKPIQQLEACWTLLHDGDLPLSPRLVGAPGLGKTTLAQACAQKLKQDVYLMQCTADTRPEDLLISPVLNAEGKISYHASPLLTAVIQGGIVILDEGNRMSEKSWASLAGLLDYRRTVESVVAGITLTAHKDFKCCITMNEDASTFEIPEYILSRLQPAIQIPFPSKAEEQKILRYHVPNSPKETLDLCLDFLQKAHNLDLPYSVRDGIHCIRFALKLQQITNGNLTELFYQSLEQTLGKEALDLDAMAEKRRQIFPNLPEMGLEDIFFDDPDTP